MATCRSCGAEIVWMTTSGGKRIPVDAETALPSEQLFSPKQGHQSHFATCLDREYWRTDAKGG